MIAANLISVSLISYVAAKIFFSKTVAEWAINENASKIPEIGVFIIKITIRPHIIPSIDEIAIDSPFSMQQKYFSLKLL